MTYLLRVQKALAEILSPASAKTSDDVIKYFSNAIIWELQKAILCGEHYDPTANSNLTKIVNTIIEIESLLVTTKEEPTPPILNSSRKWKDIDSRNFYKYILIFHKRYRATFSALIVSVEQSLKNLSEGKDGTVVDTKNFQGYNWLQDFSVVLNPDPDVEKNVLNYNVYITNILLAYLDDYLECNEETILLLRNVQNFLTQATIPDDDENTVRNVLLDKASFLEYKVQYRRSRENKEDQATTVSMPTLNSKNKYIHFAKKIENHYRGSYNQVELNDYVQSLTGTVAYPDGINFEPFHHLNRFYIKSLGSDLLTNESHVNSILDKLTELLPQLESFKLFDQIAFKSVYKLLSNSALKLQLQKESQDGFQQIINDIQTFLKKDEKSDIAYFEIITEKIKAQSNSHSFPDYYCYILVIKHLNALLNHLISEPQSIISDDVSKIEEQKIHQKISELLTCIRKVYGALLFHLSQNLSKMMSHKVKPVYLSRNESDTKTSWEEDGIEVERDLFLESSYILPINFESVKHEVQSWTSFLNPQLNILKDSLEIYLNQLEIRRRIEEFKETGKKNQESFVSQLEENKKSFNIQLETNKQAIDSQIKGNETNFSKQVKESEFKMVQIVAMFVSIATFVLINVKIFDNKTGLESIGIILGLAGCFFLFNLFFYITSLLQFQGEKDNWKFFQKIFKYLMFPIIFVGAGIFLLYFEGEKTGKHMQEIDKRLDSLIMSPKFIPNSTIDIKVDSNLFKKFARDTT